jgi:hypothetical protein
MLARDGISSDSRRLALIDLVIQDFTSRLGVSEEVTFSFVAGYPRLISVERVRTQEGAFLISIDEDFLRTLDDNHICAAIAHELGHVWIYTHFPYLHTESLANQQALKLVSREDLDGIYEKVRLWKEKQHETAADRAGSSVPQSNTP